MLPTETMAAAYKRDKSINGYGVTGEHDAPVERSTMAEQVYRLHGQVAELHKAIAEINAVVEQQAARLSWIDKELGR